MHASLYYEYGMMHDVGGEGLAPIVSAYSRLILVDGTVLWAIIHVVILNS